MLSSSVQRIIVLSWKCRGKCSWKSRSILTATLRGAEGGVGDPQLADGDVFNRDLSDFYPSVTFSPWTPPFFFLCFKNTLVSGVDGSVLWCSVEPSSTSARPSAVPFLRHLGACQQQTPKAFGCVKIPQRGLGLREGTPARPSAA